MIGVPTVALVFRSMIVVLNPFSWNLPVLDARKVRFAFAAGPSAVVLPAVSVPALIVTPPVKVFAPLKVQVPVPDFVTAPLPVPMILEILPVPDPVSVKLNPEPVIVPAL